MKRIVIDTNLVLSGLLWGGMPEYLFTVLRKKQVEGIVSNAMLDELKAVLSRSKFAKRLKETNNTVESLIEGYLLLVNVVQPADVPADAVRDPKDIMVLACAVGGKADFIITGGLDLLDLGEYEKIAIVTLRHFVEQILKS